LQDLRSGISIVPLDPVIFSANALENIRYGRPSASDCSGRIGHAPEILLMRVLRLGLSVFTSAPAPLPRREFLL
jgi:ABC-type multidrug transport system fused ATPase/permease subunit